MTSERRYSITPLVEAMNLATGESVSRALGISGSALTTYTTLGIDEKAADRLTARAGFVAWAIWPELLDQAMDELKRDCAAPDCPIRFEVKHRGAKRRWCSDACKGRTWRRERYQSDEQFREEQKARRRAYYEECGAYERAREVRKHTAARERRAA